MKGIKGYVIYATYDTINEKTVVQLFGRLENGQSFVSLHTLKPYFFVREKDTKKISLNKKIEVEKGKLTNFKGEPVVKLTFDNHKELNLFYKEVHKKVETYEADVKPHYRFLIDCNLLGSVCIEGEYESAEKVDRVYREATITPSDFKPALKVVSIDTESDKSGGKLYNIGIYSGKEKKTFMVTKHEIPNVVACKNEAEALEKFRAEIARLDPDIITGWNVIDFDFVFLKKLFMKHKVPFDLGRTNDNCSVRIESGFFRSSSADVPGRQVMDGMNLLRDPFIKEAPSIKHAEFTSMTLENVSQALLKKGKNLKGKDRHKEIERLFKSGTKENHKILADYNIMDCQLAYEILEKTSVIDLAIERTQLTGLPLDKLTASVAAFDSLYMRAARARGLVSPTNDFKQKEERIKGGYVHSSKPGIYKNVLIMDFKSLYPSIIRTFNIDPASQLDKKEKGSVDSPNGAHFKNQDGILPAILDKLHAARERAKKEKREFGNHAIKVIMNSFFGVLANPACRYFNLDMANAITHFGQFIIKLTAEEIEKKGYRVIYSDTDSVFVETRLPKAKADALGAELAAYVNEFYEDYVKKNYSRRSFLELQFDKQYVSMMIPQIRGSEEGAAAKKRYAGLREIDGKEKLEITGLEAIRGDWTEAAQEFQVELLGKAFHDEPVEKFIRDYVKKLRDGKMDAKLVYRKSIRKELEEYTKTTPPHVKAARKLGTLESNVIEYYITDDGPEPIQKLKHKIDYDHYVDKQIKPIANQILSLLGKDFEVVMEQSKQTKLF